MLLSTLAALALAQAPGTCTIRSATGVAFGSYDPIGANAVTPRDATGQIRYSCRGTAPPVIGLSAGRSGTYSPRAMRAGTSTLPYNLYRDAARAQVWGDGSAGTSTVVGSTGRNRRLVVYGRIPPGLVAPAGAYADTIVATFNF